MFFSNTVNGFGTLVMLFCALLITPPIKCKLKIKPFLVTILSSVVALFSVGVFATPAVKEKAKEARKIEQAQRAQKEREIKQEIAQPVATTPPPAESTAPSVPPVVVVSPPTIETKEPPVTIQKYDVSCKVVGISDGDTINCLTDDKTQIKIRFDQIDAPEKAQDFGTASKQALSDMIFNKTVEIDAKQTDKYGRTVAEVYYNDKNINQEMVAIGMAWAYREYLKDNYYIDLENNARLQQLGIWSQPNPIYPSDFRRAKRGEQNTPIQTQQIAQSQEKRDLASSGGQCGSKRYCKQMTTCSEAKHYLNVCGVSRLDKDGDGVPCESLCK
ncbi:thermonuclease family protein [Moraxella nasovis]|uniref:thermonuclease family protein n=1 Tax=Moraxella nasovis TaxID=2904121 RepID=UPI001F610B7C|nr:thermonuclease family protein [Moraxella nasovis]UNU74140.1 thermonuclease family protein [Moraxella nasovis]